MTNLPTAEEAAAALTATMKELAAFSRVPFRKVLGELLGAAPTPEAVAAFAAKYPDKWAAAVSIFSGLAGFEKGVVALNFYNIGSLSDVHLLQEIAKGDEELARLGLRRAPVTFENPPQPAEGMAPVAAGGEVGANPLGVTADTAQENRREAPRPAAEPA